MAGVLRKIIDSAASLLDRLKSVDGAGSGLDADLLDGQQGSHYATSNSPTLTGVPLAPTATGGTNTTQVATTAFVTSEVGTLSGTVASTYLPFAGGTMSGSINMNGSAINSISSTEINGTLAHNGTTIGFFGVTPATQATTTEDIKDALTRYGLLNGTSATPLNLDGGAFTAGAVNIGADSTWTDGVDIAVGTSSGTKIGTATTQKIGFFNATPVVQQSNGSDIKDALVSLGLLAQGFSASPLNLDGGALTAGAINGAGGYFSSTLIIAGSHLYVPHVSIAATPADGLYLAGPVPASSGTPVQMSPRIRLYGSAWKSNATAASQSHDFTIENLPATGAAATTATLRFGHRFNGAAFTYPMTLSSAGDLTVSGVITANGSGLTALNASNISSGTLASARLPSPIFVGGTNSIAFGTAPPTWTSTKSLSVGENSEQGGNYNNQSGNSNTQSGDYNTQSGYYNNQSGNYGLQSGAGAKDFALYAAITHSAGYFVSNGDAQKIELVARIETTDATPGEMFLDGSSSSQRITLQNDSTYYFKIKIAARRSDADNESAAYELSGCIDRNANAASTALVGTVTKTVLAEDTSAWDVSATADTTNGSLKITVTGGSSKTIRWVAWIELVQVTG
jgi:hypothetical protein